LTDYKGVTKY
jgi:hypothetical protein